MDAEQFSLAKSNTTNTFDSTFLLEKQQSAIIDREQSIVPAGGAVVLAGEHLFWTAKEFWRSQKFGRFEKECYMIMKLVCFSHKSSF